MQAVILAGGKGTRLGKLTKDVPKPMLDVNGKPFLEHLLIELRNNGIKNIVLCIGYLSGRIKGYFGNGSGLGLRIKYSVEGKLLDTGGALKKAEKLLNQNFILLNGDTYLPVNYRNLIGSFKNLNKKGMAVVYAAPSRNGNISVEKNLVAKYDKKLKNMHFTDAGVQIFKKDILKLVPKNKVVSLEEEIFPKLIKERQLAACMTKKKFYDIGTHEGLKIIRGILK